MGRLTEKPDPRAIFFFFFPFDIAVPSCYDESGFPANSVSRLSGRRLRAFRSYVMP